MNDLVKLRIGKPNSDSLTLNQYYQNEGVGLWSYDKNLMNNKRRVKICNWNQTKMIIADIESFTPVLCHDFTTKYYIKFNNAIITNVCDINFNGQCSRKYN